MSYINSTLIFRAGLDIYPLILKIKVRNNAVFKTVHALLPTAEQFRVALRNTEDFPWKTPRLGPELPIIRAVSKHICHSCILDLRSQTEDNKVFLLLNAPSPLSLRLRWPPYPTTPSPTQVMTQHHHTASNIWLRRLALELPGAHHEAKAG